MRRGFLAFAIATGIVSAASAQDLERKGVSSYGVPAARKLYAQPQVQYGGSRKAAATVADGGRDFTCNLTSGGYDRQYLVHIPRNYNPRVAAPVVLVFHGLHMNARMMPPLTGMNSAADRYGFVAVYPNALGGRWNDGFQSATTDDVAFVQDVIGKLGQAVNIDPRRVYACGLSNGGYFSQKLACDLPGRIAGIAVVAASSMEKVCSGCAAGSLPVMFFFGTEDPLVPREGESKSLGKLGEAVGLGDLGIDSIGGGLHKFVGMLSQQEAAECWARRNGAGANPNSQNLPDASPGDGCRVKREIYGGGRREVAVYTVEGGGHSWPGGLPVAKATLGRTTGDINASALILEFFRTH